MFIFAIIFAGLTASVPAHAEFKLDFNETMFSCPLNPSYDPFQVDGLISIVKAQLDTKLEHLQQCRAPLNQLSTGLSSLASFQTGIDPALRQEIFADVYGRRLNDLNLQKTSIEASGQAATNPTYPVLISEMQTLEDSVASNQVDELYNRGSASQTREAQTRLQLYQSVNQVLSTIQSSDPKCIDAVGGWQTLLPQVLSLASVATGFSGMAYAEIAGVALQIASSLTAILQDAKVKKAINDLVRLQNDQILGCTYFALKYSACEYRRAYAYSGQTEEIRRLFQKKYSDGKAGDFERFFYFNAKVPFYYDIFNQVASMGSVLTFDLSLIFNYINALKIDPVHLDPAPADSASDADKTAWLILVRNRGVPVQDTDNFGRPKSIADMMTDAKAYIAKQIATIESIEAILRKERSFEDLRHELDAHFPSALQEISELRDFLHRYDTTVIPERERGAVIAVMDLLDKFQEFLSVQPDDPNNCNDVRADTATSQFECYTLKLNKKGTAFFDSMARGAVAQLNSQSVLTLGSKARDRLVRALTVVENEFLFEDLHPTAPGQPSFREYRRDRELLDQVLENYAEYRATGTNFRAEKFETVLQSFEGGFSKEIRRMVRRSLNQKSELVPEIRRKTAPHLCALFASTLAKTRRGRKLLDRCRAEAPALDQIELIDPKPMPIDFDDVCFYPTYSRTIDVQKLLVERMRQSGPAAAH